MTLCTAFLLPLLSAIGGPVLTGDVSTSDVLVDAEPEAPAASTPGPSTLRWTLGSAPAAKPRYGSSGSAADEAELDWLDPSRSLSSFFDGEKLGLDALHVDVLLRGVYSEIEEEVEDELGTDDFLGFNLIDGDVALSAFRGAWSVRASVDAAGKGPGESGPGLEDAYVRWSDRYWGDVTVGRFKPYVMRSSETDPEHLIFPTRTFLGSAFDRWDEGLEWHGVFDEFDWWLSASNREDSLTEENQYTARGEWAMYDAWWAPEEGARHAPDHLRLIFGFVYVLDTEDDGDHNALGLDYHAQIGPHSLLLEWMGLERDVRLTPTEEADLPFQSQRDAHPWSLTYGRMFGEEWQAAFRVQDADDAFATKAYSLGVNWFPFDAPIALLAEATSLDRDTENGVLLRVGFSFGLTRHDEPVFPR